MSDGRVPMSHWSAEVTRRNLLQTTALGAAAAATGLINAPALVRAQVSPVKLGVLHPVSGALSYSGQQGRLGATIAIEEINAAAASRRWAAPRSSLSSATRSRRRRVAMPRSRR